MGATCLETAASVCAGGRRILRFECVMEVAINAVMDLVGEQKIAKCFKAGADHLNACQTARRASSTKCNHLDVS